MPRPRPRAALPLPQVPAGALQLRVLCAVLRLHRRRERPLCAAAGSAVPLAAGRPRPQALHKVHDLQLLRAADSKRGGAAAVGGGGVVDLVRPPDAPF
jgi:hypothetical protein